MSAPVELRISGAEDLAALAKRLKAAGDPGKGIRKELLAGIRLAAKPMVAAVKANADPALPTKGGLSRRFKTGVGVRTRVAGQSVGVRIVGKNGYDVEAIDAGYVRHPVFGNRKAWVLQRVQAGWFTKPIEAQEHTVRAEVLNAIDRVARKVEG